MTTPSSDPSVEGEPHLNPAAPSDSTSAAERPLGATTDGPIDVDHTVWDEPSLVAAGGGSIEAPEGQLTYERWLARGVERFTSLESWTTTLLLALSAGPWGILGALLSQSNNQLGFLGILSAAVLAPVTEEITKIAGPLWVVEKRPYWFRSSLQIMLCAAAGGLAFAFIENLIYLFVYHREGGADFAAWRWIVCTALHLVCSLIAGVGLVRIWRRAMHTHTRPELAVGMPWFAAAMVVHGLYNFAVTIAAAGGWLTFD